MLSALNIPQASDFPFVRHKVFLKEEAESRCNCLPAVHGTLTSHREGKRHRDL